MPMKTKKLSLLHTVQTKTCRGVPLELQYELLTQCDRRGSESYGVKITARRGAEKEEAALSDLTSRPEKIRPFIDRLARGAVTPECLREVVEDWL